MRESLIRIEHMNKVFVTDEEETHALRANISKSLRRLRSISGPLGCGKSTPLAILGLLDSPSKGLYTPNGREVESRSARGYGIGRSGLSQKRSTRLATLRFTGILNCH